MSVLEHAVSGAHVVSGKGEKGAMIDDSMTDSRNGSLFTKVSLIATC